MAISSAATMVKFSTSIWCHSKENSNTKSVHLALWNSDACLIFCWELGIGGLIIWGLRDCNAPASYTATTINWHMYPFFWKLVVEGLILWGIGGLLCSHNGRFIHKKWLFHRSCKQWSIHGPLLSLQRNSQMFISPQSKWIPKTFGRRWSAFMNTKYPQIGTSSLPFSAEISRKRWRKQCHGEYHARNTCALHKTIHFFKQKQMRI